MAALPGEKVPTQTLEEMPYRPSADLCNCPRAGSQRPEEEGTKFQETVPGQWANWPACADLCDHPGEGPPNITLHRA